MHASPRTPRLSLAAALIATVAAAGCSPSSPPVMGTAPQITIPGTQVFPESVTSTGDGTMIIGSIGTHQIFRTKPGARRAEPWILPGTDGLQSVLGVFADEVSGTLYACSNTLAPGTPAGAPPAPQGQLYAFDLGSGAPRGHHPLPGAGALCNDIAVGPDGAAYATDTNNMQVVRLARGAPSVEVWAGNGVFGPKDGLIDGIAVLGNRVLVSTLGSGRMFSVPILADGSAGPVTEIRLSRRIERPDAIRSMGPDSVLVVERGLTGVMHRALAWVRGGGGALSRVNLAGDTGTVTTLRRGYPDDPVSVAVLGETAYVLEGQLDGFFLAAGPAPAASRPFRATAVRLGLPLMAGKR